MSLLDDAKKIPRPKHKLKECTMEEIELAIAWLCDDVSLVQVMHARSNLSRSAALDFLARRLKDAYKQGFFKLNNA